MDNKISGLKVAVKGDPHFSNGKSADHKERKPSGISVKNDLGFSNAKKRRIQWKQENFNQDGRKRTRRYDNSKLSTGPRSSLNFPNEHLEERNIVKQGKFTYKDRNKKFSLLKKDRPSFVTKSTFDSSKVGKCNVNIIVDNGWSNSMTIARNVPLKTVVNVALANFNIANSNTQITFSDVNRCDIPVVNIKDILANNDLVNLYKAFELAETRTLFKTCEMNENICKDCDILIHTNRIKNKHLSQGDMFQPIVTENLSSLSSIVDKKEMNMTENEIQESKDGKDLIAVRNMNEITPTTLSSSSSVTCQVESKLVSKSNSSITRNGEGECESKSLSLDEKIPEKSVQSKGPQAKISIAEQKPEIEMECIKEQTQVESPKNTNSPSDSSAIKESLEKRERNKKRIKERRLTAARMRRLEQRKVNRSATALQKAWREYLLRKQHNPSSGLSSDSPLIEKAFNAPLETETNDQMLEVCEDLHTSKKLSVPSTINEAKEESKNESKKSPLQNKSDEGGNDTMANENNESKELPQSTCDIPNKNINLSNPQSLSSEKVNAIAVAPLDNGEINRTLPTLTNGKSKDMLPSNNYPETGESKMPTSSIHTEKNTISTGIENSEIGKPEVASRQPKKIKKMGPLAREHTRLQKQKSVKN